MQLLRLEYANCLGRPTCPGRVLPKTAGRKEKEQ